MWTSGWLLSALVGSSLQTWIGQRQTADLNTWLSNETVLVSSRDLKVTGKIAASRLWYECLYCDRLAEPAKL